MWFGTRVFMQEIEDPQPEPEFDDVGWGESTQYLNGGLGVSQSASKHGEYSLEWLTLTRAEARKITDYADGVYGDGLIYWLDPVAIDQNVLPQSWAVPALAAQDAVPLVGTVRPTTTDNTNFSQGYPAKKAVYTVSDTDVARSIFIPIPPGYSAWVGVHGDVSAQDFVKVIPYTGSVAGTAVFPTILSVSTTTRVNTEIGDGATGLELTIDVSAAGEAASFTLSGLIVQVLPDGVTPETGGFISGQGQSGCRFLQRSKVPYGTSQNLVSLSVRLGEVGEWV